MNVEIDDRGIGYAALAEALSRSPVLKLDANEFLIKGYDLTIPRICGVRLRHEFDVTRSGGVSALTLTRVLGGGVRATLTFRAERRGLSDKKKRQLRRADPKKVLQMHPDASIFVKGKVTARTVGGGLPTLGKRR